jgi:ABC-2 type transport system permease protein
MMSFTLIHVVMMYRMAPNGIDSGPLVTSYLGIALLGMALLAIGTLTSSMTANQVVAAFLGVMITMVLWFMPFLGQQVFGAGTAVGEILTYIGISEHYLNFGQGVVDTRDVVYFVTLTVGALFVATRVLETRRWR